MKNFLSTVLIVPKAVFSKIAPDKIPADLKLESGEIDASQQFTAQIWKMWGRPARQAAVLRAAAAGHRQRGPERAGQPGLRSRTSLIVALIATVIGLLVGLVGGYRGGWLDDVLTAITNVGPAIPAIVVIILVSVSLPKRNIYTLALVIGLTAWFWVARAVRAQASSVRTREHIDVARLSGAGFWPILARDVLPYLLSYVVMAGVLQVQRDPVRVDAESARPRPDEATSMLDASLRVNILNVRKDLRDELGMTILFITHDIGQACYLADRVLVTEHGAMVEQGNTDDVIFNPQHEYTRRLLADVPKLYQRLELEID